MISGFVFVGCSPDQAHKTGPVGCFYFQTVLHRVYSWRLAGQIVLTCVNTILMIDTKGSLLKSRSVPHLSVYVCHPFSCQLQLWCSPPWFWAHPEAKLHLCTPASHVHYIPPYCICRWVLNAVHSQTVSVLTWYVDCFFFGLIFEVPSISVCFI